MRLGIDCGGTNTKLVLTADDVVERAQLATIPTPRGANAMAELIAAIEPFTAGAAIESAAMSLPGIIDEAGGRLIRSANLPWFDGRAVAGELTDGLGIPVSLLNDGTAAAIAEARLGAGRGHDDVFVVALGTGVAGAHVRHGDVLRGAHGAAGEFGHVSLDDAGEVCPCGQRGCLETFVGGVHLARHWSEASGDPGTAKDLFAAAARGDAAAVAIVDAATTALARGLLGVVATLDPGLIVLGGGIAQAYDQVALPTIEKLRARATFHQLPDVVPAELGTWAGAWGAALVAEHAPRTAELV
jgi:glucokinase